MRHRKGHVIPRNLTSIDRRRIYWRKRKINNQVRLAQALGVLAGLSVTTGLFAHDTRGTYAMFTGQQTIKMTFTAAGDFQKRDGGNTKDTHGDTEKSSALRKSQSTSKESHQSKNSNPSTVKGKRSWTNEDRPSSNVSKKTDRHVESQNNSTPKQKTVLSKDDSGQKGSLKKVGNTTNNTANNVAASKALTTS